MATVFDFNTDQVKIYCDGEVLTTSSIGTSFNLRATNTLQIPSLSQNGGYLVSSWENTTKDGPVVGNLGFGFTPWILGGGFTDGIEKVAAIGANDPGFLGYNTNTRYGSPPSNSQHSPSLGGITSTKPSSGLDGFLGSFKVYSRALSNSEVRRNFNLQKGFYKNIKV